MINECFEVEQSVQGKESLGIKPRIVVGDDSGPMPEAALYRAIVAQAVMDILMPEGCPPETRESARMFIFHDDAFGNICRCGGLDASFVRRRLVFTMHVMEEQDMASIHILPRSRRDKLVRFVLGELHPRRGKGDEEDAEE